MLGVSPQIAQLVAEQNKLKHLGIKVIDWSAPFFNAKKFLEYKPKDDRAHFFRDNFGITLSDSPTVCMVANFLSEEWKDHPALLEAIRILVQDRDVLVQLLLAGDGPRLKNIKKLARTLGIEKSVFFLGYTTKIPELISFSDIKVVSSKSEAFCIALLEAALLKKPLIGTRGTGMENIVKDEDTGLLFARGDSKDLADKIEFLLKNEQARSELGLRAFSFVNENFLPEVSIKRIERFYTAVLSTTGS